MATLVFNGIQLCIFDMYLLELLLNDDDDLDDDYDAMSVESDGFLLAWSDPFEPDD